MRNFDTELEDNESRKYAYNFDLEVIHPFMVRAFSNFFKKGSVLELGSYFGYFTSHLCEYFSDITCVEASSQAIDVAKERLQFPVEMMHSTFEEANLNRKYDNVVMTHVLEHLDNPVEILKKVNEEWLSEDGLFFLACPNANAPSRQIAVKMGLISHNAEVTEAERQHGHRITYSLDTLERDAKKAGLNVVYRSGIFFKALANFQWDHLLGTSIISNEYLEGCYKLGQQYPDLCSTIYLVCKKGS